MKIKSFGKTFSQSCDRRVAMPKKQGLNLILMLQLVCHAMHDKLLPGMSSSYLPLAPKTVHSYYCAVMDSIVFRLPDPKTQLFTLSIGIKSLAE